MGTGVIAGANATDIAVNCGPCGNETGNGNEIIRGPDGQAGADSGRVFRPLTVHPSDPDTILMGTELGYTSEDIEPGTDTAVFQPDLDPSTQTDPLNPD